MKPHPQITTIRVSQMKNALATSMFLVAAVLFLAPLQAFAGDSGSSALISKLPAQIPEILTGGKWSNGDVGGVYRAVVVVSQPKTGLAAKAKSSRKTKKHTANRKAEVFVQWIDNKNGKASPRIVKTVSIKEFNEKQLRHAFLAMDTLTENEMTLLVTSYDARTDKDVSVSIKATAPGQYEAAKNGK